ncbi:cell volume regulation protein A [Hathewaya proteolytica DSM 3090]|uniref:Cell volume regulation protein A n=1 Tax=Hathewaya proteolytica DSM 3090 TaxID=1121331 RepID=A0A1M6JEZ8_9CLOT|nr:potassium/proton antiporter [Hathewaya proteolytica]SHJ45261.1 cell volume regulation protein A [Hathewaya proteolytica DSM 3090]
MAGYILLIAIIILICLLMMKVSSKIGIPVLLAFILLGMLFGSDGIFKIYFDNYDVSEKICSFALIFIMFYGGFGTNWKTAKPIVKKSILLSSLGVVITALVTGLFCFLILKMNFWESMLIGSVISSTDAASVFSILRSKQISFKDNTASMLEMESGSNDPCSYMLTVMVLSAMKGEASGWSMVYMILAQIIFGVVFGVLSAWVTTFALSKMKNIKNGFDTIFVFSMALISYAGSALIGGNGYLSTYIAGIILGNKPLRNKITLVHFFDGITTLMQMLIFFLLGLLSFPSQLPNILIPALAIAVFLTFVSRPIAVFAILTPFKCSLNQKLLVSWTGIRGAASIVFAIMATVNPAYLKHDVFHIVFFIVLMSVSIQGSLIPLVSRKLNMIDDEGNIMKTFSDYSEEMPIQFVKINIIKDHPWINKKVRELTLLPGLPLVLIQRGKNRLIPKGNTTIFQGDTVVLSALSLQDSSVGSLTEMKVEKENALCDKTLSEVKLDEDKFIVLIIRNEKYIIPNGRTLIREDDTLVISQL